MPNKPASSEAVRRLVLLRTLVAALGERATPPWWRTQFLTYVGLRALDRVFPRTATQAALESTTVVARAAHDKRIGVGRRYHFFRLPANLEQSLIDALMKESFHTEAAAVLKKAQNELLQELAAIADSPTIPSGEGAIRLGPVGHLLETSGIAEMAAHYRASFATGHRLFPYFDECEAHLAGLWGSVASWPDRWGGRPDDRARPKAESATAVAEVGFRAGAKRAECGGVLPGARVARVPFLLVEEAAAGGRA